MAIVFNGTDQAIKELAFATDFDQPFTLAIKFKGAVSSGGAGVIGAYNTSSSLNGAVYLRRRTDLNGWVLQQLGNADANTSPSVSLVNDVWHTVVLVNNGDGTADLYLNDDAVKTTSFSTDARTLEDIIIGAAVPFGNDTGETQWFNGKCAYYRRSKTAILAANAAAYNSATSETEVNAVLPDGANLISDASISGAASALTNIGAPTYDTDTPFAASATPTITDINTNNQVTPGATATLTGTNLTNATGVNVGSVSQTGFTVVSDTTVTFTCTRGGNPYNQDLTATLLSPDGNATITVQQVPEAGTFAVTAASPNTTDDASLWSGLVDTATGDPVTVVDGDQAWVKTLLDGLAISPDGTITANETGTFTVQFWRASEGVWGSDQTVNFTLPAEVDDWPYHKNIRYRAEKTWTWGPRHPKTSMRVRIFNT